MRADDEIATGGGEAVAHHGDEHRRVDVPAREHAHSGAGTAGLAGEQRGDRHRPGALDDELDALQQEHDRLADLVVGDGHDVVQDVGEDRAGQLAGVLDRDAVGDRVAVAPRLDAHDPHLRADRAQRERDPRCEPAASDRDEHRSRVRHLLRQLEPDRSLTGDDRAVLVRVDERRPGLVHVEPGRGEGILEMRAAHDRLRAVVPAGLDLRHRCVLRHVDPGLDARLARRPGHGLPVVARACRDDAGGALPCRQRGDLADRAARLERPRALEVLRLQVHAAPGQPREGLGRIDRGHAHHAVEATARLADLSLGRGCTGRQP